jgi:hypothetical protein
MTREKDSNQEEREALNFKKLNIERTVPCRHITKRGAVSVHLKCSLDWGVPTVVLALCSVLTRAALKIVLSVTPFKYMSDCHRWLLCL